MMETQNTKQDQWNQIKNIWKQYETFYDLLRGFVTVTVLLVFGSYIFINKLSDFSMNAFTEAVGVLGTALILDRLYQRRAKQEQTKATKADLILQMGSPNNAFAIEAIRRLRDKGWLTDGTLKNARLHNADLTDAYLRDSNMENTWLEKISLQRANLSGASLIEALAPNANLQDAILWNANLEKSWFTGANLAGAALTQANLANTRFSDTNLQGAYLVRTKLTFSDLSGADLRGAYLKEANIEKVNWHLTRTNNIKPATLPDGTLWTEDTNMLRFTDPLHPDYETTLKEINHLRDELGFKTKMTYK